VHHVGCTVMMTDNSLTTAFETWNEKSDTVMFVTLFLIPT
jgi:hypothetical protein